MRTPSTLVLEPWLMTALPGEAHERTSVDVAPGARAVRVGGGVIFLIGMIVSLFAAAVSWAFTVFTGTALWTLEADSSAAWKYALGMNLVYWNTWAILTPAILSFAQKFPLEGHTWRRSLPWHIVGGLLFVAAHVAMAATGRTWLQQLVGMRPSWWRSVSEAYLRTLDWELTFYWAAVGLSHAMVFYRAAQRSAALSPTAAAEDLRRSRRTRRLWVRTDGGFALVSIEEVDWIEAAGNYVCLHVGSETHVIRESLKNLERRLEDAGFLRINRPTIVNLERVKAIETRAGREPTVVLRDGTRLLAARQTEQKLRAALDRWEGAQD